MNADDMIKLFYSELGFFKGAWLANTIDNTQDFKSKFSILWSTEEAHRCLAPEQLSDKGKCETDAERMRTEGNILYKDNELDSALDCYNLSILLAPHPKIYALDSQETCSTKILMCKPDVSEKDLNKYKTLALAYANRSAVFLGMREYDKCLEDIELAKLYGYPEDMKTKLEERKERCRQAKVRNQNSIGSQYYFLNNDISPKKLSETSSLVPAFSSSLCPKYSEEKGRHVVAAKDIQPGDILALEESYCSIPFTESDDTRCPVCLKLCCSIIPCPTCRKALFCSDACRAKGLLEHQRACKVIQITDDIKNLDVYTKMALKLVSYATFAELKDRIPELEKEAKYLPAGWIGFNENGKFTSTDYRSMYHAVSFHSNGPNVNYRLCLEAFIATKILVQSGTFFVFKDGKPFSPEHQDIILTGAVILHHINSQTQSFTLRESKIDSSKTLTSNIIGYGFFPSISMLRHSCNANTTYANFGKVTRLMAIGFIAAGQEVFVSYVGRFQILPMDIRKTKLEKIGLQCSCEACIGLWPLKSDVPDILIFKCVKCNGPVADSVGSPCCTKCDINYSRANSFKNSFVKKWWCQVDQIMKQKVKFERIHSNVGRGQSVTKENFVSLCTFSKLLHQHVQQPALVFCNIIEAFSGYSMYGI